MFFSVLVYLFEFAAWPIGVDYNLAQSAEGILMYSCSNMILRFGCCRMNGKCVVQVSLLCLTFFYASHPVVL